jgi:5-methylcytosine-specific restriction protein A
MPVTKGAGNPDWTRDETLLALNLLYQRGKPVDRSDPEVVELSSLLRSANIHPQETRKSNFRNPDGVALKLQNLLSAEDENRGLSSSALDREIVGTYPRDRAEEVASVALSIRQAIENKEAVDLSTEDEVFSEGHILTSRHRSRDQRLRRKLLAQRTDDQLICAICDCTPPPGVGRQLKESFFEAHHVRPLSEKKGVTSTRVADMALLCAGCHRFIHKLIVLEKHWFSIADARHFRATGAQTR